MLTRLQLFAWLVSLEALDVAPERQAALRAGYDLASLGVEEGLLARADTGAHGRIAQLLAELEADGWIAWDWVAHAGDPRPEQPASSVFDEHALQRVQNVRITPEGYAAYAARQGLGSDRGVTQKEAGDGRSDKESRYDLFISHASEDKDAVARPLAEALTALGFAIWYDEEQLQIGSSLRTSIDAGLAESRYGVVILSRMFFEKPWTQQELNGLVAREMADGQDVILPLWHEVDAAFLTAKAPMIADRFALRTSIGIPEIAERLARRLRRERGREQLQARSLPRPPDPSSVVDLAPAGDAIIAAEASDEESGLTVRARVIALLRASDDIGIREFLRFERRMFDNGVLDSLRLAGDELGSSAEPERLAPVEKELWGHVDRRLGSLLPVLEYRPDMLFEELRSLTALSARSPATRSPYSAWVDGTRWPVWLVTLILGTAAVALRQMEAVRQLWLQRAPYDRNRPLPVARLGGAAELGAALTRARKAHVSSRAVELWYPAFAVFDSDLLRSHYTEIMEGEGAETDTSLGFLSKAGDFLWLCGALAGRDGVEVIRFWSASQVHPTIRERLASDPELREQLAKAVEVKPEELLAVLDRWMENVAASAI